MTALYERQRALVRLGHLPKPQQTGRNSGGAQADPRSVAIVLISLLATDALSEMDERIAKFLDLRPSQMSRDGRGSTNLEACPITGQATFLDATQFILEGKTRSIVSVSVEREVFTAAIRDPSKEPVAYSYFGNRKPSRLRLRRDVSCWSLYDLYEALSDVREGK